MRPILPPVLLLLAATAGCFGAGDDGGDAGPGPDPVTPESRPQLEGWVLDPALRPLGGTLVTVVETGAAVSTDAEGHYALDELPTGTPLVLVARADGFIPQSKRVTLEPKVDLRLNFSMQPVPVLEPYQEVLPKTGFVNCQLAVESEDAYQKYDCSGAEEDTDTWDFPVDSDLAGIVFEVFWEPQQPAAAFMRVRLETVGFGDLNTVLDVREGESPVKLQVSQAQSERFYREGGIVRALVEPSANLEEQEMGAGTAAFIQQEFDMFASNFYVDPPPTTYSVADGS